MSVYELRFTSEFLRDKERFHKSGEIKALKKLADLLRELAVHPTLGTGKPKPLFGDRAGQWSRSMGGITKGEK
jgi:toxin YoeB